MPARTQPLAEAQNDPGDQQKARRRDRRSEQRLKKVLEQIADDCCRHRANDDPPADPRVRVGQRAGAQALEAGQQQPVQIAPKYGQHGQPRAPMDDGVKGQARLRPVQQPGQQHQVAGTGDGDEFGGTLEDAEEYSL